MNNGAFRRLNNEWYINCEVNPVMDRYCRKVGINPHVSYLSTDKMREVQRFCEKRGVWLRDSDEAAIFIEVMPFGGYEDNYEEFKVEIARFRVWAKDHNRRNFVLKSGVKPLKPVGNSNPLDRVGV